MYLLLFRSSFFPLFCFSLFLLFSVFLLFSGFFISLLLFRSSFLAYEKRSIWNVPRSAGEVPACRKRAKTLRWARGREGCSDSPLPTSELHPPRNATTATAASGGNREELLGQRPARRACRPRHDADAGCRNPEEAEAIPNCFTFQPAPCLQIEFAAFLRFTAIFSNFTAM